MKKVTLILIAVFIVFLIISLIVGILAYKYFFGSEDNGSERKEEYEAELVEKEVNQETENFVVNAKYPQIDEFGDEDVKEDFNEEIEDLIQKEIGFFKVNIDDSEEIWDFASELDINYIVSLNKPSIISIIFDVSVYYSGSAHPVNYTRVFNYDLKNNELVYTEDIFEKGSNYLQVLSDYSVRELIEKLKPDEFSEQWIHSGAGAELENYKNVAFKEDGLIIIFEQYQVAAYVEGKKFIEISYAKVEDVLDSNIISLLEI